MSGSYQCAADSSCEELQNDIIKWVSGIQSEVDFWEGVIANASEKGNPRLQRREFLDSFISENGYKTDIKFRREDRIIDIGCGGLPTYGDMFCGQTMDYYPCDPLAYEYQTLYELYKISPPVRPHFALMEALSYFVDGEADYVICRNALDHSLNPIISLLESLRVLKQGGTLILCHMDCEGESESYNGLHQWNITLKDKELIFFNRKRMLNISDLLSEFCTVKTLSRGGDKERKWIIAEIRKNKEIPLKYETRYSAKRCAGMMIQCLMQSMAKNTWILRCGETIIPVDKNYIIWGIGTVGETALHWFGDRKSQIVYFVDRKVCAEWKGFKVKHFSLLERKDGFIIVASSKFEEEIVNQLIEMGYKEWDDFLTFNKFKRSLIAGII